MSEPSPKDPLRISLEMAQDGDVSGALEQLEEALGYAVDAPSSRRARWRRNAGMFCEQLGKLEQAAFHYRDALELEPEDGFTHLALAAVYTGLDREDEASEHRTIAGRLAAHNEELAEFFRKQSPDGS